MRTYPVRTVCFTPPRSMIPLALVTQPVPIFFIVLAIILLAPLLLNRLKIPHIIGMIAAGVIVGPYGCNILSSDSSFAIFGQVGLLYLMFLAGLEIDMYHLKLNLRRGMLFGVLTLAIPLLLGILSSRFVLGLDTTTSMLLGAMYAAHTLISYPVAARFGITKTPAVLISIVGTIMAVVGALIVIAATVSIQREGHFNFVSILLLVLRLGLWAGAAIYVYPRITRWFFKTYSDRVTQYVFIMTLVFLAAWTAQLIGLEAVLGAFMAGLVLNRFVPMASPLMSSIEFVGNAIFIPYFLISVGMMINLSVALNPDTLAVAGIMLSVALVSKWLPAFLSQKINRLDPASRSVMFGLTAAHTAVALAVVTLGYQWGMLSSTMLNATILVILVTCAIAPMITAGGAAKLKISTSDQDDLVRTTRTNNSLIAVSNPLTAASLVELGVLMRNDRGTHNFHALHVRNENTPSAKAMGRSALDIAAKTAASAAVKISDIERYDLNTVTGILNAAAERDITEIILGMHRRGTVIDTFLGMKVEQLLKCTNRMLIISRCFIPLNTVTRIMVAVPRDAQYETGFSRWVRAVARLTRQLGCRVIFCCHEDIQPLIRGVLYQENYGIRCEFRTVDSHDDMILLSPEVLDDDLLITVSARPQSVSYTDETTDMLDLLQRNFSRNNLLIIYPEQYGEAQQLMSFSDPMTVDRMAGASWVRTAARVFKRKI